MRPPKTLSKIVLLSIFSLPCASFAGARCPAYLEFLPDEFSWVEGMDREVTIEVETVLRGLRPLLVQAWEGVDLRPRDLQLQMNYVGEHAQYNASFNRLELIFKVPQRLAKIVKNRRAIFVHEYGHPVFRSFLSRYGGPWAALNSFISESAHWLQMAKDPDFKLSAENLLAMERLIERGREWRLKDLVALENSYAEVVGDTLAMVDQGRPDVIDREADLQRHLDGGVSRAVALEGQHITLRSVSPIVAGLILQSTPFARPRLLENLMEASRVEIETRFEASRKEDWRSKLLPMTFMKWDASPVETQIAKNTEMSARLVARFRRLSGLL